MINFLLLDVLLALEIGALKLALRLEAHNPSITENRKKQCDRLSTAITRWMMENSAYRLMPHPVEWALRSLLTETVGGFTAISPDLAKIWIEDANRFKGQTLKEKAAILNAEREVMRVKNPVEFARREELYNAYFE